MKQSELKSVILNSASERMKKEGQIAFDNGLVTYIKGKNIEKIYHIYGRVKDKNKVKELNTHIKINLINKKLEKVECSCDEFKELSSNGYTYMCSHLTATAYKFFSLLPNEENRDNNKSTAKKAMQAVRLTRKIQNGEEYYIAHFSSGSDRLKIKPNDLRAFLEKQDNKKIKFIYEHMEITTPIIIKNLPVTFNLKDDENHLIVTSHKHLPIPLNSNNDVYFFKNELYLPSKKQISVYRNLYKKLKTNGKILYKKDVDSYDNIVSVLSAISEHINISDTLKNCIESQFKPEFYIYEEDNNIYCDVFLSDGKRKINILSEDKKQENLIIKIENRKFKRVKDRFIFLGEELDLFNIVSGIGDTIKSLGEVNLEDQSLEQNNKSSKLQYLIAYQKLKEIKNTQLILTDTFKGKLRSYQVDGVKWLINLSKISFGGILADEMGLGKTIQIIAFLLTEQGKKTIIVCPTSLIYNWKAELEKFAPSLRVLIVHGQNRDEVLEDISKYDIVLTTYGTLRMDIENYSSKTFDYFIIDEAQNIKNSQAQNTKVIKEIKADVRFALTGTPIENNLSELWSIFDFVVPGYLYSKEKFEERFAHGGQSNLEILKALVNPFILRRTKKEVIKDLPDKDSKNILVDMTEAQNQVYRNYIKNVKELLKDKKNNNIQIFSYLTKLRQICLDPALIKEGYNGGSGKLEVAMELISEHLASGGKVLLFSQFTSVLNKIGKMLDNENIGFYNLDGKTKPKDRIKMVNEFNRGKVKRVFLISLKAGGTGLNLTSANLVIHFDPWWNPAVEDQATDRAHRIGQTKVVEVIKLIARGTIEEKIIMLQEEKKELIDNVINSNSFTRLSKEEILKIFD